eukprot:PhF_6_TR23769/c0_g1_i2/m.33238
MSKVSERLINFFVFNPTITNKEEKAHENVLYYYPPTTSLNTQMNDCGLAIAFSGLTEKFTDTPLSGFSSDRSRTALITPEKDFWIGCTVRRTIESERMLELEESHTNAAIHSMLHHAHSLYCMHYNTFLKSFAAEGREKVCESMKKFFDVYMLMLSRVIDGYEPLLDAIDSVTYLPADRTQFLSVLSLLNKVKYTSPDCIEYCMVVVDDCILYTELDVHDTLQISRFLSRRSVRKDPSNTHSGVAEYSHAVDNLLRLSHVEVNGSGFVGFPTPFMMWLRKPGTQNEDARDLTQHQLLFFSFGKSYIIFVLRVGGTCPCNTELVTMTIRSNMGLLTPLQDCVLRSSAWDESYSYVYINQINMALKTSVRRRSSMGDLLLYAETAHRIFQSQPASREVCLKARDGVWIVCMRSGPREFYLVFDKAQTMGEVAEEVKRISSVFFHGLFL